MPKRCYECGRIAPESKSMERRLKVQLDGDGWRKAVLCTLEPCPLRESGRVAQFILVVCDHGEEGVCQCARGVRLGTDPTILCPPCEDADDIAAAREALAEDGKRVTHEELKEELGIE